MALIYHILFTIQPTPILLLSSKPSYSKSSGYFLELMLLDLPVLLDLHLASTASGSPEISFFLTLPQPPFLALPLLTLCAFVSIALSLFLFFFFFFLLLFFSPIHSLSVVFNLIPLLVLKFIEFLKFLIISAPLPPKKICRLVTSLLTSIEFCISNLLFCTCTGYF